MIVNKDNDTYIIEFEENELKDVFYFSGANSILKVKNRFIKMMAEKFDNAVGKNLGLTFPYTIGNRTFYGLKELEDYIIACQNEFM